MTDKIRRDFSKQSTGNILESNSLKNLALVYANHLKLKKKKTTMFLMCVKVSWSQ